MKIEISEEAKQNNEILKNYFKMRGKLEKCTKLETYVFEKSNKKFNYFLFFTFFTLFFASFLGVVILFFTNGYNNLIYSQLILSPTSKFHEMWKNPSPKPTIKIYLFNYTNVEDFENGIAKKLRVEEKGPYVYEEKLERVNVEFNSTFVYYQQKKTYKFIAEKSEGNKQNDLIQIPNVLMLAIAAMNRNENFFTRLAINSGLDGLNANKVFMKMAADRFLTGYDDDLYSLAKSFMKLQDKELSEKAGLLAKNIGINKDVLKMHTGKDDINKLGYIYGVNEENSMNMWSTEECNSMGGSDGSMFPPPLVASKAPVRLFLKDMCRTFHLNFEAVENIFGGEIESHRYILPHNVFEDPENYPQNQCFCEMEGGTCPLRGLYNTTLCSMGAPTFVSHPHFYGADEKLLNMLDGLSPSPEKYGNSINLHPKFGFPMRARSRIQVNAQILKSFGFSKLEKYENGLVLPLAWMDLILEEEELPSDVKTLIFTMTRTVKIVEIFLKISTILTFLFTFFIIVINLKRHLF